MKTLLNQAAITMVIGLLLAGIAAAQVRVETPPGTGQGTLIQAGPANVQTGPGGTAVAVPPGTAAAIEDNAAARQENRIERRQDRRNANAAVNNDWRMRRFNNRWWYWNPNNSWSYHNGTVWVPYNANTQSYTATQAGPMRTRRYSSGYRGNMIQTPAPAVAPNTNVLPNNTALPSNQPTINNRLNNNQLNQENGPAAENRANTPAPADASSDK